MKKRSKKLLSLVLAFTMVMTGMSFTGTEAKAENNVRAEETQSAKEYEIYPTPKDVTYEGSNFKLETEAKVVYSASIDDATKAHLDEILEIRNVKGTETDTYDANAKGLKVLVGVNGEEGAAATFFEENSNISEGLFDKRDAYALAIFDGTVAILGKDTDAAYYGLTTLKLIFEQSEDGNIENLYMEDWADGQYRGFIEGYYGIPWSTEDRISLMEFGGDFKMNMYIYAPKDEPYHNKQWRTLYPPEMLEDIKKMAEAGNASKCRFAWAIHPFMNTPITADTYEEDLKTIKTKFEQLYSVGVRQFVLSADDAGGKVTLHARLCKDLDEWCKAKGDVYNLCFVPQVYCANAVSWSDWAEIGEYRTVPNYFKHFEDLPDVELMWTGEWVCYPASQTTFDNFTNRYTNGREAFMWLNWPVNDVNHKRLVMGPAESCIFQKGLTNFMGIVTNPLEQGEASKTALFATADFTWNTSDFEANESWEAGFKYIDEGAPEALHELCKHMTNPSPGGITQMGESVELTPYINAFTSAYNNKTDLTESGTALVAQLQKIVDAANEFQTKGTNENLKDEMKPWVDSLRYLSKACIGFVNTAMALNAGDDDAVAAGYLSGVYNYRKSQNCSAPQLEGTINAEAGAMKIIPFAETMSKSVKDAALKVLNNNFTGGSAAGGSGEVSVIYNGIGGLYEGTLDKIIDGNDSTYAWFNQSVSAGAYIGLDLGGTYKLGQLKYLQGTSSTNGDIFSQAVLEYSLNGENWETIKTYSGNDVKDDLTAMSIKARFVRMRTASATGKWFAIREFSVETLPVEERAYTNVDAYKETSVMIDRNIASIPEIQNVTLQKGEFIGLEFGAVREITEIEADYTNADKVTFEYSYNNFDWYPVEIGKGMDAKYIRLINKADQAVSFDIHAVNVKNTDADKTAFTDGETEEGCEATNAIDHSATTAFKGKTGKGTLTYRMEAGVKGDLYILQDAETISNAVVSVRTNTGKWVEIGKLSKSLNVFNDLSFYIGTNELKITWDGTAPMIYEIYSLEAKEAPENALKAELAEVLIEAEESAGSEEQYTKESWEAFEAACKAIKELPADADAETIAKLKEALKKAKAALVPQKKDDTGKVEEKKLAAPSIQFVKSSATKQGVVVKVTVNAVAGADHYEIYRTVNGTTVLAGTTASGKTVFEDTAVASLKKIKNASYHAVAVSKDTAVKASDKSAAVSISFAAAIKIKKAVPAGKKVKLTWKKDKKATGYVIYRSAKKNAGYKLVKKLGKKAVSYQDKKIKKKGTYYYRIVKLEKGKVSPMSAAKKAKVK